MPSAPAIPGSPSSVRPAPPATRHARCEGNGMISSGVEWSRIDFGLRWFDMHWIGLHFTKLCVTCTHAAHTTHITQHLVHTCTTSCYLILSHTTSCYFVLSHTTSCYLIPSCYLVPPHAISYYLIPPHTTSYYLIPHTISYHLILPHAISYYLIPPYYFVLFILPHAISYYLLPHTTSYYLIPLILRSNYRNYSVLILSHTTSYYLCYLILSHTTSYYLILLVLSLTTSYHLLIILSVLSGIPVLSHTTSHYFVLPHKPHTFTISYYLTRPRRFTPCIPPYNQPPPPLALGSPQMKSPYGRLFARLREPMLGREIFHDCSPAYLQTHFDKRRRHGPTKPDPPARLPRSTHRHRSVATFFSMHISGITAGSSIRYRSTPSPGMLLR